MLSVLSAGPGHSMGEAPLDNRILPWHLKDPLFRKLEPLRAYRFGI